MYMAANDARSADTLAIIASNFHFNYCNKQIERVWIVHFFLFDVNPTPVGGCTYHTHAYISDGWLIFSPRAAVAAVGYLSEKYKTILVWGESIGIYNMFINDTMENGWIRMMYDIIRLVCTYVCSVAIFFRASSRHPAEDETHTHTTLVRRNEKLF